MGTQRLDQHRLPEDRENAHQALPEVKNRANAACRIYNVSPEKEMRTVVLAVLAILLMGCSRRDDRSTAEVDGDTANTTAKGERFLSNLELPPKGTNVITIATSSKITVGFRVKNMWDYHQSGGMVYISDHRGGWQGASTGSWLESEPQNGEVAVKLENCSDKAVSLTIYTKEPD